jgi:hypothetical protein
MGSPSRTTPPECCDRAELQEKYSAAEANFESVRRQLQERIGVLSRDEYDALRDTLNRAWGAVQDAGAALDRHIREHGCGVE